MTRSLGLSTDELIVDLFAGGGGASEGIKRATGREPDLAVNHDPEALAMHEANHPRTRHLCGDVWDVKPRKACRGRRVGLLWASPDCTFHSKARGGVPFRDPESAKGRRGLAWVAIRWAKEVRPRIICLENVEEFQDWAPIGKDGKPDPMRTGLIFRIWVGKLRAQGYQVEWRELRACDYGAPTTRRRLFIIARCDGAPIVWPAPTHGPGLPRPHRAAAECIDWSIPCRSIFGRKKPLAEPTLRRIARGLQRFVLEAAKPFVVRHPLRAPVLIQSGYGERDGQDPRVLDIKKPMPTIVACGVKQALCTAFLAKHFGGNEGPGAQLGLPMATITCRDHHGLVTAALEREPADEARRAQVRAFLIQYNGQSDARSLQMPLGTVTTRDRFGLVYVEGEAYEIVDIGHRMLAPRELFRGQGFTDDYVIDPMVNGRALPATAQVRMCGNSVSPDQAAAIVAANVGGREAVAA